MKEIKTMRSKRNTTRVHAPSEPSYLQHAMTWACGTARKLGITWAPQPDGSIDATIPEGNVMVCEDSQDFVRFVREEQKARRVSA